MLRVGWALPTMTNAAVGDAHPTRRHSAFRPRARTAGVCRNELHGENALAATSRRMSAALSIEGGFYVEAVFHVAGSRCHDGGRRKFGECRHGRLRSRCACYGAGTCASHSGGRRPAEYANHPTLFGFAGLLPRAHELPLQPFVERSLVLRYAEDSGVLVAVVWRWRPHTGPEG